MNYPEFEGQSFICSLNNKIYTVQHFMVKNDDRLFSSLAECQAIEQNPNYIFVVISETNGCVQLSYCNAI